MTTGKWMCSSNEERWDHGEEFDTRDEAMAYALSDFASEYGLEDGDRVWIGQIRAITPDDIASYGADADRVIDNLNEQLYELVGDEVTFELSVSKAQEADLDERLRVCIRDWMLANCNGPTCFTLDHVESDTYEQCKETRTIPQTVQLDTAVVERCIRHIEHDGGCEWPTP